MGGKHTKNNACDFFSGTHFFPVLCTSTSYGRETLPASKSLSTIHDRSKVMGKMTNPSSQRKSLIVRVLLLCQEKKKSCKSYLIWSIPHGISLNSTETQPSLALKFSSGFPASSLAELRICSWFPQAHWCVYLVVPLSIQLLFWLSLEKEGPHV